MVRYAESLVGRDVTIGSTLHEHGRSLFKRKFAGVFAADQVPRSTNFTYAIVNLDPQDKPGSHWIAMAKLPGGRETGYLVYDSFGRPTEEILPTMPIPYQDTEDDAEQKESEDNCGARCLAWLIIYDMYGPNGAALI